MEIAIFIVIVEVQYLYLGNGFKEEHSFS